MNDFLLWKNKKRDSGHTLVEILVALAVVTMMALAAGSIVGWITNYATLLTEKNKAETNLLMASYRFKTVFSLAVNVGNNGVGSNGQLCTSADLKKPVGGCITTSYNTGTTGVQLNSSAKLDGTVDTLARFFREGGTATGQLMENAIFYRRPDVNSAYADGTWPSGALYFVNVQPGTAIHIGPEHEVYDHIVNMSMVLTTVADNYQSPPVQRAKSATITLTERYFIGGRPDKWLYCPPSLCGNSFPSAPYKDETITFSANFLNNVLYVGTPANGDPHILNTLYGNIYFLQPQLPHGF